MPCVTKSWLTSTRHHHLIDTFGMLAYICVSKLLHFASAPDNQSGIASNQIPLLALTAKCNTLSCGTRAWPNVSIIFHIIYIYIYPSYLIYTSYDKYLWYIRHVHVTKCNKIIAFDMRILIINRTDFVTWRSFETSNFDAIWRLVETCNFDVLGTLMLPSLANALHST